MLLVVNDIYVRVLHFLKLKHHQSLSCTHYITTSSTTDMATIMNIQSPETSDKQKLRTFFLGH